MSKELIDKYNREKTHMAPKNFKDLYKTTKVKQLSSSNSDTVYFGKKTTCSLRPTKSIMNASLQCKQGQCQATCLRDYQFPNKEKTLYLICNDGEWSVKDTEWDEIPSCER